MAKDDEKKPTAAEKGKAKATNGEAEKEVKKDKDGKPIEDKKGALPAGMFSPAAGPPPHATCTGKY
jgi:26S proteasome regulatory subunit N1